MTIVWIAARFTEEHRSTLDWLNRITDNSFRFFGLELELWRIGDSPPARALGPVREAGAIFPIGTLLSRFHARSLVSRTFLGIGIIRAANVLCSGFRPVR